MGKKIFPAGLCLAVAMGLPFLGAWMYFVLFSESSFARVVYIFTKGFTLVWPGAVWLLVEKKKISLKTIFRRGHLRALSAGFVSGFIIGLALLALYRFSFLGSFMQSHSGEIRSRVEDLGFLEHFFVYALFLSVGHSLLEEYYWRWYIFGGLSQLIKPGGAYLGAGLSFAAHHYIVLGSCLPLVPTVIFGTAVGLGGVWWCWLYRRYESLAGCWMSHLLVDGAIMVILYDLLNA